MNQQRPQKRDVIVSKNDNNLIGSKKLRVENHDLKTYEFANVKSSNDLKDNEVKYQIKE